MISLILPGMVFADSGLKFDSSGRPSKLVLGGKDMLRSGSSAEFVLHHSNGKNVRDTRLDKISTSGNKIRVSDPDGQPNFTFEIDAYPNHLTIQLLDAQGIGTGRDYSLSLELGSKDIAAYTPNDLMAENTGNRRRKNTVLSWPYLWGRPRPDGTHGSVVLYDNRLNGSARDAVLAEIWSVEGTATGKAPEDSAKRPAKGKKAKRKRKPQVEYDWVATSRPAAQETGRPAKIYLHIFKWPGTHFEVKGMTNKVGKAYLLGDAKHAPLEFSRQDGTFSVALPAHAPDPIATVVCLECAAE